MPVPVIQKISFISSCLCSMLSGMSGAMLSSFYPGVALDKGISVSLTGNVFGIRYISMIITSIYHSKNLEIRYQRSTCLLFGLILNTIGNISFSSIHILEEKYSFLSISFLMRILVSIGEASILPSSIAIGSKALGSKYESLCISAIDSCYTLGLMLGPSLGGVLFDAGGVFLPFLAFGTFSFCLTSLVFIITRNVPVVIKNNQSETDNSLRQIFINPQILISIFGLTVTSSAWDWYQSSIATFLQTQYSLSVSEIGLVLVSSGLAYIITSPICGIVFNRIKVTLWAHIIGLVTILFGYVLFGPIPQFKKIASVPLTVFALAVQGSGFSISYLGSLLFMKKCVTIGIAAEDEMITGQISSVWLLSSNLGSFVGSLAGASVYDALGFQMGTAIEACALSFCLII